jgi:hypothetical protein
LQRGKCKSERIPQRTIFLHIFPILLAFPFLHPMVATWIPVEAVHEWFVRYRIELAHTVCRAARRSNWSATGRKWGPWAKLHWSKLEGCWRGWRWRRAPRLKQGMDDGIVGMTRTGGVGPC